MLRFGVALLALSVAAAGLWVRHLNAGLPDLVVSHFAANGMGNGHMPRAGFATLSLLLTTLAPLAAALLPAVSIGMPGARINLPHRELWLSPPHREATIGFLRGYFAVFGAMLALFMAYVFTLVARANAQAAGGIAMLDMTAMTHALLGFIIAVLLWLGLLGVRFSRTPASRNPGA